MSCNSSVVITVLPPPLLRYLGRKRKPTALAVQPPFLRPQLSESQLNAKVLDNGILGDMHRVRGLKPTVCSEI